MTTLLAFHEVDDTQAWLAATTREEVFGPRGITARTFVDPQNPNRVGLLVEVPSIEAFQAAMATPEAAEAMKKDGVRPETLVILNES
jgi:hypothetical protein